MERLSDRAIEIINDLHTERLDYESEYMPLIDAAQRLAEYEDTCLEPEDIDAQKFLIAAQKDPAKLERLRKLVEADVEGRCIILWTRPGTVVYRIAKTCSFGEYEKKGTFFPCESDCEACCEKCDAEYAVKKIILNNIYDLLSRPDEVFSDYEDAESKLNEMRR